MKKNKISTLELALSRHIEPDNTEIIGNAEEFNLLAKRFLAKKSAVDGLRDYMKSQQYSPRALGLLIYSDAGRDLLRQWVGQGMDVSLLYHAMINDGLFWQNADGRAFPLFEDVAGSAGWDFEPKEFLTNPELLNAVPGLLSAMVERLRRQDRIADVFRYFTRRTLNHLIRNIPDLFKPEIDQLPGSVDYSRDDWEEWVYSDLIRVYLDPESAVRKMLGARAA